MIDTQGQYKLQMRRVDSNMRQIVDQKNLINFSFVIVGHSRGDQNSDRIDRASTQKFMPKPINLVQFFGQTWVFLGFQVKIELGLKMCI